jgi:hypothetical protein
LHLNTVAAAACIQVGVRWALNTYVVNRLLLLLLLPL